MNRNPRMITLLRYKCATMSNSTAAGSEYNSGNIFPNISVERFCESVRFTQPYGRFTEGGVGVIPNPCFAHGESRLSIRKWACAPTGISFSEKLQQKESFVFHRSWRGGRRANMRKGRAEKQNMSMSTNVHLDFQGKIESCV